MNDAEREALVERMAEAVVIKRVGDEKAWNALPKTTKARVRKDIRAALAVAEPVVREDEREACAKAADAKEDEYEAAYRAGLKSSQHLQGMSDGAGEVAAAIRARGDA